MDMNIESYEAIRPFSTIGSIDKNMDILFLRGPLHAVADRRKMEELSDVIFSCWGFFRSFSFLSDNDIGAVNYNYRNSFKID